MSQQDFSQLTHRFRDGGEQLSDAQFHLLFQQINTMFWNSPESLGAGGASGMANTTYSVVLYEIPPFVRLSDLEGASGKSTIEVVVGGLHILPLWSALAKRVAMFF